MMSTKLSCTSLRLGFFYGVRMRIEKWHEMSRRHKEERRQIIEYCKAHKMTQKDAAAFLGISLSGLNKYIKNNGIRWHTPKRVQKKPRVAKPLAPDAW